MLGPDRTADSASYVTLSISRRSMFAPFAPMLVNRTTFAPAASVAFTVTVDHRSHDDVCGKATFETTAPPTRSSRGRSPVSAIADSARSVVPPRTNDTRSGCLSTRIVTRPDPIESASGASAIASVPGHACVTTIA
jgi:hypothetical protein